MLMYMCYVNVCYVLMFLCPVCVRPVAQLVEHRTPNLLPVRARVRDASALDI